MTTNPSPRLIDVSTTGPRSLHVWIGGLGLHLFWPDLWKSRLDYTRNWK